MKRLDEKKQQAISLRLKGMSYSQIKEKVGVSKSTLSLWLEKYPLSPERIRELQSPSPQRIERCRNTKLRKKQEKLDFVYKQAKADLSRLSKREMYLAGLFLYWGEGTKTARASLALTNTDPSMMRFFVSWMELLGVPRTELKVRLHLYIDMDAAKQIRFWSDVLKIPPENFMKPYIKDSKFSSLTYKNSFGQGTCSVTYGNARLHDKVMMSLKYLRDIA